MLWSGFCVDAEAVPADLSVGSGLLVEPELTVDGCGNDVGLAVFG